MMLFKQKWGECKAIIAELGAGIIFIFYQNFHAEANSCNHHLSAVQVNGSVRIKKL